MMKTIEMKMKEYAILFLETELEFINDLIKKIGNSNKEEDVTLKKIILERKNEIEKDLQEIKELLENE